MRRSQSTTILYRFLSGTICPVFTRICRPVGPVCEEATPAPLQNSNAGKAMLAAFPPACKRPPLAGTERDRKGVPGTLYTNATRDRPAWGPAAAAADE